MYCLLSKKVVLAGASVVARVVKDFRELQIYEMNQHWLLSIRLPWRISNENHHVLGQSMALQIQSQLVYRSRAARLMHA